MAKKLVIIFLLLFTVSICYADYELLLSNGITLRWHEYSIEGSQCCTQKEAGKFCIQRSDVVALKKVKDEKITTAPYANRTKIVPLTKPAIPRTINAIPVRGIDVPGVQLLDKVMLNAMQRIGCSAATLSVADHGTIAYSRGYGWIDKERKIATQPDTMIGIASCEKPVTAAAIKQLARDGRLDLDTGLFALLKIKPRGPITDSRMNSITIRHILEHKAGWGPDPVAGLATVQRKRGVTDPLVVESTLSLLMTRRLKHDPGSISEYCNFGYDTLRYVLQKISGKKPDGYFRTVLFKPDSVRGFYGIGSPHPKDAPPLVWNAETGGPVSASAPALLTFMRHYWLTGEPRDRGNPLWVMYGSLDGSTAIMVWRPDGIDFVALFNGRGSVRHDEISRDLQSAIDSLKEDHAGSLQ